MLPFGVLSSVLCVMCLNIHGIKDVGAVVVSLNGQIFDVRDAQLALAIITRDP